ncbi:hypothetical protein PVA17_22680 [Lysinibacillus sp. CNPSo 3705]|uniref:hypothetical protein n=1 Tax=Lysinibacillus sp. CNPSo 3705 TaxID=3028148 RepID=UPI0023648B29|nr:hypothetical protein [Lysinibacillus sp. CNPSo 3705]MDD1505529.1 hypothetical protein [Lysinibacillus sp. CNPSo 3705]
MKWILEISDNPIDPNYPVIGTQVYDNGTKKIPVMLSMEMVVHALTSGPVESASTDNTNYSNERRTPILPPNTISFSTSEQGEYERLTMTVDKSTWFIRYHSEETLYEIPFPKMIFQIALRPVSDSMKRRVIETNIYAILDSPSAIDEDTELFYFPYPNVSKESGKVCWGSNTFTLDSVAACERFFTQFVAAPFNEDYGMMVDYKFETGQKAENKRNGQFKEFIQHITDNKILQFEDDWLLPTNKILADILGKKLI